MGGGAYFPELPRRHLVTMNLLEEAEVKLDLSDLLARVPVTRPSRPPVRESGIHLSGVLRYILTTSRMPGWQRYMQDVEAGDLPLLWALGIAWEEFAASLYRDLVWQPSEIEWHGIWMNADGLSYTEGDCGEMFLEEFKYTTAHRKKSSEFLADWLKMQQGKGYCLGYGCKRIRWHVLWNGALYKPVYVRYLVEFSNEELAQTEQMLLGNRVGAMEAGYAEAHG